MRVPDAPSGCPSAIAPPSGVDDRLIEPEGPHDGEGLRFRSRSPSSIRHGSISRTHPLTGTPIVDGEQGELVFTTLTKQALPIIRYRTHDISSLQPGTARPNMRRIKKITGRNDDMIILRGVNLFPSQIEEIALRVDGLSPHFILELATVGRMDCMTVKIEPDPSSTAAAERAADTLCREIKTRIGSTVTVELAAPGSLERSGGKLKRVYDLRAPR